MYLFDSNIIIYSYSSKYEYLRDLLLSGNVFVSEITRVEVLGYHQFAIGEKAYYDHIFNVIPIIYPSGEIFDKAIEIKQLQKIKLGDSLIAATALVEDLTLYTRNVDDFNRIDHLKYINPIKDIS